MDLIKDLTSIRKHGGVNAAYIRSVVDSSGNITFDEANWHDAVYRIKSSFNTTTEESEVFGEAGELQATEEGNQSGKLIITSSQFDAAFMRFARDETGGDNFYSLFIDWGKGAQGKQLEVMFALVTFSKSYGVDFPGRKPDLTVNFLSNRTSFTPASLPSWAAGSVGDFVVAAGNRYEPFET